MINKKLLGLLLAIFILSGCSALRQSNYKNSALAQLEGKHISLVQQRIDRFVRADTGSLFRNKYYLYSDCVYSGYDNVVYNGWGQILSQTPINHCGYIYFVTNKDGVITDYVEKGYTPNTDFESYFRDLIVIEH